MVDSHPMYGMVDRYAMINVCVEGVGEARFVYAALLMKAVIATMGDDQTSKVMRSWKCVLSIE